MRLNINEKIMSENNTVTLVNYNVKSLTGNINKLINNKTYQYKITKFDVLINELIHEDLFILSETWKDRKTAETLFHKYENISIISTNINSNSKGVILGYNNNKFCVTASTTDDIEGRYIIANILHKSSKSVFTLVGIYAPDAHYGIEERISFYHFLTENSWKFKKKIIICGDYNLDPQKIKDQRLNNTFKTFVKKFKIINCANERIFTFQNHNGKKSLDHTFVSKNFFNSISPTTTLRDIGISDHIAIKNTISLDKKTKVKQKFIFNSQLLRNNKFTDIINKLLKEATNLINNISEWNNFKIELCKIINDFDSAENKKNNKERQSIKNLLEIITLLNARSDNNYFNSALNECQLKYHEYNFRYHERIYLNNRSIADFGAEMPNKITTNIIHKISVNSEISIMHTNDNRILTEEEDISKYLSDEFGSIFCEKEVDTSSLSFNNIAKYTTSKITDEEKKESEDQILNDEVDKSLKKLKSNKAPGPDGLTNEFYIHFQKELSPILTKIYNQFINSDESAPFFNYGFIKCIPKKVPAITHFNHIRPISLLNTDYKILSSIFADRVLKATKNIIHEDQSGYIPGRNLADNMQKINAILENYDPDDTCIILIDFQKAFDIMNHSFIYKALKLFGFTKKFCNIISKLWSNATASILVNNKPSKPFDIKSGVRQGDPLAGILFVLCLEILANAIRSDQNILPITSYTGTHKTINLHCDDIALLLKSYLSVHYAYLYLLLFCRISGMIINVTKTNTCNLTKYKLPFAIMKDKETLLGFDINSKGVIKIKPDKILKLNMTLEKIKDMKLSIIGKRHMIETYAFSQLTFLSVFIDFSQFFSDIKKNISETIWNIKAQNKKGKYYNISLVSYERLVQPPRLGGIGMMHLESHCDMMCAQAIIKWLNNNTCFSFIDHIINSDNNFSIPWKITKYPTNILRAFEIIKKYFRIKNNNLKLIVIGKSKTKINFALQILKIDSEYITGIQLTKISSNLYKITSRQIYTKIPNSSNYNIATYKIISDNTLQIRTLNSEEWKSIIYFETMSPYQILSSEIITRETKESNRLIEPENYEVIKPSHISNSKLYLMIKHLKIKPTVSTNTISFHGSINSFYEKTKTALNGNFRNQIKSFKFLAELRCLPLSCENCCCFCGKTMSQWHLFSDCDQYKKINNLFDYTKHELVKNIFDFCFWKVYNKVIHTNFFDIKYIINYFNLLYNTEIKRQEQMIKLKGCI